MGPSRTDVDLRDLLDETVHAQGDRPVCVAMAISAVHEVARTIGGATPERLAPEAIWSACSSLQQTTSTGVRLFDAGDAVRTKGQPLLAYWPYNDTLGFAAEKAPQEALESEWFRGQLSDMVIAGDGLEDALEDGIQGRQAIILVIAVTGGFFYPSNGIVNPAAGQRIDGYHAVAAVGVAQHPSAGRCLLVKNSWGAGWGLGGYAWVPLAYLAAYGVQAASIECMPPAPTDATA